MSNGVDEVLAELLDGDNLPQQVSNRLILAVVLDVRAKQANLDQRITALENLRLKIIGGAIVLGVLGGTIGTVAGNTLLQFVAP